MIYTLDIREKGSDRSVPKQCHTASEAVAALNEAEGRGVTVSTIMRGKAELSELMLRAEAEAEGLPDI